MTPPITQQLKDLENVLVEIVIKDANLKTKTLVAIGHVAEELAALRRQLVNEED